MAEIRILPTNFFAWPRIRDLITQQKFICSYLWVNRFTDASGCYLLPISAAAAEMGMSESSLPDALAEFERRVLIEQDLETGEVLILDWFRWHRLNGRSRPMVERGISRIGSDRLRARTQELYSLLGGEKQKNNDLRSNPTEPNPTEPNPTEPNPTEPNPTEELSDDICVMFEENMRLGRIKKNPAGYLKALVPRLKGTVTDQIVQAARARGRELLSEAKRHEDLMEEIRRQELFERQGDADAPARLARLRAQLKSDLQLSSQY